MKCKKHPKYKGILKPRCNCEQCWRIYIDNKDNEPSAFVKAMTRNAEWREKGYS